MHKILVTGGAGYVGAVLVPKLVKAGHEVRVLDIFLYAEPTLFTDEVKVFAGDMRDRELVKQSLEGCDTVIHLAGISNDPCSDLDPQLTRDVNIGASEFLIDEAKRVGVKRFINASSSSVYGIKEDPEVTEELALEPLTIYSESKVAIEDYLEAHKGPMTSVSVRSATVCGFSPRMRLDLTVNILTHHALKKGKISVFGGSQKRPNIHIDDITDFYVRLVDAPAKIIDGQKFNVCGANYTVSQIAELVREAVAPNCPVEMVPTNDLRSYHINADKVRKLLDFVPRKTIGDAIKDVARAFHENEIKNPDEDQYYNVKVMKRNLTRDGELRSGLKPLLS